jgi:uncharacterized damage-inducible protein DinB
VLLTFEIMEMKSHLIDLFRFNDTVNPKMIAKIAEMPDQAQAINLMSHLVHSQDKWLARLAGDPDANKREWFGPPFALIDLPAEWTRSVNAWIAFLESKTEEDVLALVQWEGFDGAQWEARLCDIALQLNFHGIHHRAQIQTLVRQQGLEPDFLDYIGTKYRRIG